MTLKEEIGRRRTFAIVSHPDAGKTTLTEKMLLFGGAIHVAGAVKSNKIKRGATSDFMEIERQRGISVATSVMGFQFAGRQINILDTPGHQDFAEDTFRTLTAVDSVIIVMDAAKGVEQQTLRLMEVCRMRKTPIIVFVNKLDRPSQETFDLLDTIEKELKIAACPLSLPIGNGNTFQGVYDVFHSQLALFRPNIQSAQKAEKITSLSDPAFDEHIGETAANRLREEMDLVTGVYPEFDLSAYRQATLAPVFFGSALYTFGIRELLDCFIEIAPPPLPSFAKERQIDPSEKSFTGYVFKIHANMDPNHRDRIAFVKVCSGTFLRNTNYLHVRKGKRLKFSNPTAFMASKKMVIDEAYPGDIIGLHDTGTFVIGDTLSEGENLHFKGLPSFSPELFRYIENDDPMKSKQLHKGIDQLMDEGVAQLFTGQLGGRKIIGCVGQLQFEVIQYRLLHEYGAKCRYEPLNIYKACWITSNDNEAMTLFKKRKIQKMVKDKWGRDVFLADSEFILRMAQDEFPSLSFHFTSEFSSASS